jgi:hypothetical protein
MREAENATIWKHFQNGRTDHDFFGLATISIVFGFHEKMNAGTNPMHFDTFI